MIFIKFYFQRTFRIRITLLNTINIENNLFLSDLIFIVTYTNIISFNFFYNTQQINYSATILIPNFGKIFIFNSLRKRALTI